MVAKAIISMDQLPWLESRGISIFQPLLSLITKYPHRSRSHVSHVLTFLLSCCLYRHHCYEIISRLISSAHPDLL